jgi:hypothetical protein
LYTCMQRTARTTAICHRLPPNQTAEASSYPVGRSWAGRRANGPIRPRSGEAWPDPALFSYMNFYDGFLLLHSKLLRKSSMHRNLVIQIFL